ncbi:MAG: sulfatase [Proteiniphilum sp.]|nr:sulfatase [Proteiniphilum sp.]
MNYLSTLIGCSLGSSLITNACTGVEKEPARRPNILIAVADDQSFAHTSFAGSHFVETPGFDRVASNGIYFMNCYAGSPGSAPSRGSLVTGRHHWQNEQSGQHGSSWMKKYVPFVDLLDAAGYHTGYTGKGVDPFRYAQNPADSLWRTENAAGKAYNRHRYGEGGHPDLRPAKGISRTDYLTNFEEFMGEREPGQPFYFWYGGDEPHRGYEKDAWKRNGKTLSMAELPSFMPDSEETRGDLLDYAVEIEWFDRHLEAMLNHLDSIGELEHTIVIVTADNGMPFPRAKAYCYEYGVHVPLAISYPSHFPAERVVSDPVSFVDIAPTLLEIAGVSQEGMMPITGKSLLRVLRSSRSGVVDKNRKYAFAGRERHSSSRWNNLGFPQRAIRGDDYLLIWNMKPLRWPAGDPQALNPGSEGELLPMYGLDEKGVHHSDWAFTDIDASPSKSYLVEQHSNDSVKTFFELAYGKVPEYELYHVKNDPSCLVNLSGEKEFASVESRLKRELLKELERSGDPRIVGPDHTIFDSYRRYMPLRQFPKPTDYDSLY